MAVYSTHHHRNAPLSSLSLTALCCCVVCVYASAVHRYTGDMSTGEHTWQKGAVRCVVWETGRPIATHRTIATTVEICGTIPTDALEPALVIDAKRFLGVYRRREDHMVNGRHVYVNVHDEQKMMWFAKCTLASRHVCSTSLLTPSSPLPLLHETPDGSVEYTGWYLGSSAAVGLCQGNIMAPSSDAALCADKLPTRWWCGTGPQRPFVSAPGLWCRVPGAFSASSPFSSSSSGAGPSRHEMVEPLPVGHEWILGNEGGMGDEDYTNRASGKRRRSPRNHAGSL